jgi:hypothetical protein
MRTNSRTRVRANRSFRRSFVPVSARTASGTFSVFVSSAMKFVLPLNLNYT